MSVNKYLTGAVLPFLGCLTISACSTVPANPNYEFSSKYGQTGTDRVELAQAGPVAQPGYNQGASAQSTTPHQGQTTLANAQGQTTSTSPTEQAYNADQMVGTPGYEMMRAQQQPQTVQTPTVQAPTVQTPSMQAVTPRSTPQGARPVDYDYAQNVTGQSGTAGVASGPGNTSPIADTAVNVPTGQRYVVQPGDTVYSLSRRLCAPIIDITTANGIGADYAISIGQTLLLPNSRC
jgi:LysM repeat protein